MTVFTTSLKRIFKVPMNWAALAAFPLIIAILLSLIMQSDEAVSVDDLNNVSMLQFGITDNDNTVMSAMLANQLSLRYNIVEVAEEDITARLTEQQIFWILKIKEGYEQDVLNKNTELASLEGYSLTMSDVSALGSQSAESITRALMLLGTNDQAVLSAWAEAAKVDVNITAAGDNWELAAFFFGFFGFISLFTAYFVIKTLLEDKRLGMPDRVGVLPISSRSYLTQGAIAAFAATEIMVVLSVLVTVLVAGMFPNILWLFLLLSLYNLFSVSFVLAITSIMRDLGSVSVFISMFATVTSMLGGLWWPIDFMPEFMQRIGWFMPAYWFGEGLRNIQQEIDFKGFIMPLLFLAGFTVVTLLIGGFKKVQKMDEDD